MRIEYPRHDKWYKHLKGFVFEVEPYRYGYYLPRTEFNQQNYALAKKVDPDLETRLALPIIYLLDVSFLSSGYSQEEEPYLFIGQEVQLFSTPKNRYRFPQYFDMKWVRVAGFKENGDPYFYHPKLKVNKYREDSLGIRHDFKIEDIYDIKG